MPRLDLEFERLRDFGRSGDGEDAKEPGAGRPQASAGKAGRVCGASQPVEIILALYTRLARKAISGIS